MPGINCIHGYDIMEKCPSCPGLARDPKDERIAALEAELADVKQEHYDDVDTLKWVRDRWQRYQKALENICEMTVLPDAESRVRELHNIAARALEAQP